MANEDHITLGHARMLAEKIDKRVDDVEKTVKQNDEENDTDLSKHTTDKSNPHSVTKSQVGLGNVPNVATNDQTPTYTEASTLTNLTSGEKMSIAFGKIKKAISDLISHKENESNPHSVNKSQLGLGNVENKSASTILEEMTKEQVVKALGYTPPETAGNNYTHPSYTARTGVPTADATLSHGATFTVTQPVSDAIGHITALNKRTYTLPSDRLFTTLVPTGTAIPANADLNTTTYLKVGRYYCSSNANAATLKNCPLSTAFMMEVSSPLSTTIDNETTGTWVYRLRKITHYNTGVQYIQYCYAGATAGTWTYGDWTVVPIAPFTIDSTDTNGGSATTGSANQPVYVNNGKLAKANTYAGGTAVTLNGTSKAKSTAAFYAPVSAGASGQILKSSGSGAPSWMDILPIENGGTGANNAVDALKNLGGTSIDLLWENASPTSTFESQTLNIDLSAYSMYIVIASRNTEDSSTVSNICKNNTLSMLQCVRGISSGYGESFRKIGYTSANALIVYNAYKNGVQNNDELIPLYVYGVKGV